MSHETRTHQQIPIRLSALVWSWLLSCLILTAGVHVVGVSGAIRALASRNVETNTCQLNIETPSLSPSLSSNFIDVDGSSSSSSAAIAGNAFTYDVSCHVNDPKMRPGDKYYIIDLILYGPNKRVAKAWRQQFPAVASSSDGERLSLSKTVSFRSLGENTLICSASKYNSLLNKFVRTCQKSHRVNVMETIDQIDDQTTTSSSTSTSSTKITTTTTTTTSTTTTVSNITTATNNGNEMATRSRQIFVPVRYDEEADKYNDYEYGEAGDAATGQQRSLSLLQVYDKRNETLETSDGNSSATARIVAKQRTSLDEVSTIKKSLLFAKKLSSPSSASASSTSSSSFNLAQPLLVASLFLLIFFVAIVTIVYLAYYQHQSVSNGISSTTSSDNGRLYTSVNVNKGVKSSTTTAVAAAAAAAAATNTNTSDEDETTASHSANSSSDMRTNSATTGSFVFFRRLFTANRSSSDREQQQQQQQLKQQQKQQQQRRRQRQRRRHSAANTSSSMSKTPSLIYSSIASSSRNDAVAIEVVSETLTSSSSSSSSSSNAGDIGAAVGWPKAEAEEDLTTDEADTLSKR